MRKTVFISSTFLDLKEERKKVWDCLEKFDVIVKGMEQFGARKSNPLATCISEVEQSDIYVGIIGMRYGSEEPISKKSYSQLEYEKAIEQNKEILIYLIDEDTSTVKPNLIQYDKINKLNNLLLHNFFFTDTAYKLTGFTEENEVLYAIVKQPFVKATEPTNLQLVKDFLVENGFINTKNHDYYNSQLDIILEDLHDENVLTKNGTLYFIDTVFYIKDGFYKD